MGLGIFSKLVKFFPFLYRVQLYLDKNNFFLFLVRMNFIIRVQKPITKLLGPMFERDCDLIEIDITYDCNLNCKNCNRSCRQASTKEQMSLDQIERFVKESIQDRVTWKRIRVLGGEPTLHSDFVKILNLLLDYRKNFSPNTVIELATNGFGKHIEEALKLIPEGIKVDNTRKTTANQIFYPFNLAPRDSKYFKNADYSNGCNTIKTAGMGLGPYGYYPCAVGGGIDRIFGYNIGRKKLPSRDDDMRDQLEKLCRNCGHFRSGKAVYVDKELKSETWLKSYADYKKEKPKLDTY